MARKLSAIADNRIVSVHFRAVTPEIFVYKIVADNGGAPCVWHGLLSLALCKPKIRKSAGVGTLIFGFGGKEYGERLIYVAEVTEKPVTGEYYRQPRFAGRPDCIYEDVLGKSKRKDDARYHTGSDKRPKDVGMRFENADVLLSRKFRYFGDRSTADYKADCAFNEVKALIEGLKRGHRRTIRWRCESNFCNSGNFCGDNIVKRRSGLQSNQTLMESVIQIRQVPRVDPTTPVWL